MRFKGFKSFGTINEIIINIIAKIIDQSLISLPFINGHKPIMKKTNEKIKPKFLSELIKILNLYIIICQLNF